MTIRKSFVFPLPIFGALGLCYFVLLLSSVLWGFLDIFCSAIIVRFRDNASIAWMVWISSCRFVLPPSLASQGFLSSRWFIMLMSSPCFRLSRPFYHWRFIGIRILQYDGLQFYGDSFNCILYYVDSLFRTCHDLNLLDWDVTIVVEWKYLGLLFI